MLVALGIAAFSGGGSIQVLNCVQAVGISKRCHWQPVSMTALSVGYQSTGT
jgi:hypothetical protein